LASEDRIVDLRPIPDADAIEVGTVRGWDVVVRKGEYASGDEVVYIEPDAALPVDDERFAFLAPRGTKTIDGRVYHVLKTARLRGQVSQGIVFPARDFTAELADPRGLDDALGIVLWTPPAPPMGADQIGGWDMAWLKKTDAERVQNLSDEWLRSADDGVWVPTEKIDGTSLTYALDDGRIRVYSRNWELDPTNAQSTPVTLAARHDLAGWMARHGIDAVQGEMYGEGVNANRLRVTGQRLALFAAWRRDGGRALDAFQELCSTGPDEGLEVVPVIDGLAFPSTVHEALQQADGRASLVSPAKLAEGIVWHHRGDKPFPDLDYRLVFKAVSATYLLTHGL
jgi:RNA ligase (TIGR02306 family)